MTLVTPAICDACFAASPALCPATSTCTSPPHCAAAVTVLKVAPRIEALSCSATTSAVISNHLGFVLQLRHQRRHVGHLHARGALGRLHHLQRPEVRLDFHAEVGGLEYFQLLFLGLHDVGQRHIARLVPAQIGGADG